MGVARAKPEAGEHAHPTVGTYLRVAAILVILTVLEVGVFYVPAFHVVLVPTLLALSAVKFALVVLFYMHLKMDSRFFSFLFGGPFLLAVVVLVALLFLFFGEFTLRGVGGVGGGVSCRGRGGRGACILAEGEGRVFWEGS